MLYKGYKLKVVHLHPANSSRKQRRNSSYMTLCKVCTRHGDVVMTTTAKCSKLDTPSRKKGYTIATDRAKVVVDYLQKME